MRIAPVNSERLAAKRAIVASFATGVSAMLLLGLAPVVAKGSLSLTSAEARGIAHSAPVIQPLDVDAIEATLALAEHEMEASRDRTDATMARLERLSR